MSEDVINSGRRPLAIAAWGLLIVAVGLRVWRIDTVPGLNGDEAWYGIQAQAVLQSGEPQWTTPNGNFMNPFFFVPTLAASACLPVGVLALRVVALASGLLMLAVNYVCCRAVFDRRLAGVSTLLLAVLPINIAYCRFGWDASQSVLFTLPLMYAAAAGCRWSIRWLWAALFALVLACVVHPTNVFLLPLLVAALVERVFASMEQRGSGAARSAKWKSWYVGLAMAAAVLWSATGAGVTLAVDYLRLAGQLLCGTTIYRFLTGAMLPDAPVLSWWQSEAFGASALALVGTLSLVAFVFALRWGRTRPELRALAIGWLMSHVGFLIVAGPGRLLPQHERYGMWMVPPTALLVAWLVSEMGRRSPVLNWVALAGGGLLVGGFYFNYIDYQLQTGGESFALFRTGHVDPKAEAAEQLRRLADGQDLWVIAGHWPGQFKQHYWIEKPLQYFCSRDGHIHLIAMDAMPPGELAAKFAAGRLVFVAYHESLPVELARRWLARHGQTARETLIRDIQGRSVISLIQQAAATTSPARFPTSDNH